MTAQKLRDAAARIRETAQAAVRAEGGTWTHRADGVYTQPGWVIRRLVMLDDGNSVSEKVLPQMAMWSPLVALAVADWLVETAARDALDPRRLAPALAVADLILGGAR